MVRTPVRRHRSHSLVTSESASMRTAAAPIGRSLSCSGSTYTSRGRPAMKVNARAGPFFWMASPTSGEIGPSPRRTSGVASITEPKAS